MDTVTSLKERAEELAERCYMADLSYDDAIKFFKKGFIEFVLADCHNHREIAANELGMHRNTLAATMRQLGIKHERTKINRRSQRS